MSYPSSGRVRRYTALETERLQGFPDGWTIPEKASIDPDELDSLRYHALGNAVTPQVAEWMAARIAAYLHGEQKGKAHTRKRLKAVV